MNDPSYSGRPGLPAGMDPAVVLSVRFGVTAQVLVAATLALSAACALFGSRGLAPMTFGLWAGSAILLLAALMQTAAALFVRYADSFLRRQIDDETKLGPYDDALRRFRFHPAAFTAAGAGILTAAVVAVATGSLLALLPLLAGAACAASQVFFARSVRRMSPPLAAATQGARVA